jgi:mycothiol synthase
VMMQRILDERPQAIDVRTTNADSNDAMLGINHALGFAKYHTNLWWQVEVDRVKAYLAERPR